jgi:quinol monooxygenase YgiN
MKNGFSEVKLFQVKPDKTAEFETLISAVADEQKKQPGCRSIKYLKRFLVKVVMILKM